MYVKHHIYLNCKERCNVLNDHRRYIFILSQDLGCGKTGNYRYSERMYLLQLYMYCVAGPGMSCFEIVLLCRHIV